MKFQAGALDDALNLLSTAESALLSALERARVRLLRAQIAFVTRRGNHAAPLLLDAADRLADLDPALARGSTLAPYARVGLLALRGRRAEAASLIDGSRFEVMRRGEGIGISVLEWAEAVLYNGLGRYEEARASALRIAEHPQDLAPANWHLAELVEAAARAGTPELAIDALRCLVAMTRASGTDWGLGIAARSQALLAEGKHAEKFYVEAIERLGRTRIAIDLARAHLLYA